MELEYHRYILIQNILQKLQTVFSTDNYRMKNLIEVWILSHCNKEISANNYMFFENAKFDFSII